ncbi:matrix protein [Boana pugnax lyssa-like virus 1]|uniref:Matrix protein n=1 Tax=Boana pugnax lyssa-like virus 1 TaxID=2985438 RepID=A0AAE9T6Q4_9RHAB|nr:matrix protein [Boana pugnax lyssa-like virus 1]
MAFLKKMFSKKREDESGGRVELGLFPRERSDSLTSDILTRRSQDGINLMSSLYPDVAEGTYYEVPLKCLDLRIEGNLKISSRGPVTVRILRHYLQGFNTSYNGSIRWIGPIKVSLGLLLSNEMTKVDSVLTSTVERNLRFYWMCHEGPQMGESYIFSKEEDWSYDETSLKVLVCIKFKPSCSPGGSWFKIQSAMAMTYWRDMGLKSHAEEVQDSSTHVLEE